MVVVVEASTASASSGTAVVVPDVVAGAVAVRDEMAEVIWLLLTEEVEELGLCRLVCDVLRVVSGSFVI